MSQSPEADTGSSERETKRTTGIITFLDVLGWKGVYTRADEPLGKMSQLTDAIEAAASLSESNHRPRVRSISGSIVLYSTNVLLADLLTVVSIHGKVCAEAITASILANIPVRGATAVGQFDVDDNKNIYVGKAIDEAASWHESADWIGVHLTPSAKFTVMRELLRSGMDNKLFHWEQHTPPMKKGVPAYSTFCVAWISAWTETIRRFGRDPQQELLSIFSDMSPITPDFSAKLTNTLAYFENKTNNASQELNTSTA